MVKPSKAMPQLYANTPVRIATDAPIHMLGAIGVVGPEEALLYRPVQCGHRVRWSFLGAGLSGHGHGNPALRGMGLDYGGVSMGNRFGKEIEDDNASNDEQ
jgi:hypothetical protein